MNYHFQHTIIRGLKLYSDIALDEDIMSFIKAASFSKV